DYFGEFARLVERRLGSDEAPMVAMMSNGASGNINNINFRGGQPPMPPYGQIRKVAGDLADEALKVAAEIKGQDNLTLDARAETVHLGVRKPSTNEVRQAQPLLAAAKEPPLTTLPEIYARETIRMADSPSSVEATIQAIRIGDLAIVAIPCEVFVEI